jgi:hypothetical protein
MAKSIGMNPTAEQLIAEARAKGVRITIEPNEKYCTNMELFEANAYLLRITRAALLERDYYRKLIVDGVAQVMNQAHMDLAVRAGHETMQNLPSKGESDGGEERNNKASGRWT